MAVSKGFLEFILEGLEPLGVMSYYIAPECIFDDPDDMTKWGREALGASLRAPSRKPKKKKNKS